MALVKRSGMIAGLTGMAVFIGLINWSGIDSVAHAVASVGWGIVAVIFVRAATIGIAGLGWWLLFPSKWRPEIGTCIFLRFVREGANVLLPMMQVGGDLIGAGLLTLRGFP